MGTLNMLQIFAKWHIWAEGTMSLCEIKLNLNYYYPNNKKKLHKTQNASKMFVFFPLMSILYENLHFYKIKNIYIYFLDMKHFLDFFFLKRKTK